MDCVVLCSIVHQCYYYSTVTTKEITMNERIREQIELLTEEQIRAKSFLNENGFDCATAPYVLVKEYRDKLKAHIKLLRMNLED